MEEARSRLNYLPQLASPPPLQCFDLIQRFVFRFFRSRFVLDHIMNLRQEVEMEEARSRFNYSPMLAKAPNQHHHQPSFDMFQRFIIGSSFSLQLFTEAFCSGLCNESGVGKGGSCRRGIQV